MLRTFITGLAVAALVTIATTRNASAQDGSRLSFDGFYLGAEVGVADSSGDTDAPVLSGGTSVEPFDAGSGRALSLFGGYQMRRDKYVFGAEARYLNLNDVIEFSASGNEEHEVTYAGDLRGRIGYVTGDWMFYGALGWSWAEFRVHPGVSFGGRDVKATLDGLNYGAGAEYLLNDRWTVGADLTFRDLSGEFDEATQSTDVDLDTFSIRVGFQF